MPQVIEFFANMPSYYRTLLLVSGLLLFWILEGTVPLFPFQYKKVGHAALNLTLTLLQLLLALAFGVAIVKLADFTSTNRFGILNFWDLPAWLKLVLGLLALDMIAGYWIHRIEHQVPWMWYFHIIHHSDPNVDATTGLRHHPVETIFRLSSQAIAVLATGVPIGILFLYQIISVFFAQLTHANIRSPEKLDRILSWILVTPNMHKVHHHDTQPLTDSNYGNVFAIWDRMFGTFVQTDTGALKYGIDSIQDLKSHNRLGRLLSYPFRQNSSDSDQHS